MATLQIETRKYLVDALNEALPRLYKALAREGKGRQASVFLQQAVARHADEEALKGILADTWREIAELEGTQ
jgi:hypothetical protein